MCCAYHTAHTDDHNHINNNWGISWGMDRRCFDAFAAVKEILFSVLRTGDHAQLDWQGDLGEGVQILKPPRQEL